MIDNALAYPMIYLFASAGGREEALFGDYYTLGRDAYYRGIAGRSFPELWFEVPLAGEPWFDLHVNTNRDSDALRADEPPEALASRPEIFEWFARAEGVRQLALSFDSHTGELDEPGIELLVIDEDQHEPFLEMLGGPEAAHAFASFRQRLPEGWFACYSGIFSGRQGSGVRVECIPFEGLRRDYAVDAGLLERDLRQTGFTGLSEALVQGCQRLAQMPCTFECQFNVFADGTVSDTLGTSLRFEAPGGPHEAFAFGRGPETEELMAQVEAWGLADERWRLLKDAVFAKRLSKDGEGIVFSLYPAFIKLRWRDGEPMDAKAYLDACIS